MTDWDHYYLTTKTYELEDDALWRFEDDPNPALELLLSVLGVAVKALLVVSGAALSFIIYDSY